MLAGIQPRIQTTTLFTPRPLALPPLTLKQEETKQPLPVNPCLLPSSHHRQNRGAVHSPHAPHTPHTSRQSRDFHQSRGFRQSQERWNRSDSINKATSSDRTGQPDRHRKPSSQFSQQPAKLTDSSPTDDSLHHRQKGDGYHPSSTSPTSHSSRQGREAGRHRRVPSETAGATQWNDTHRRPRRCNCDSPKDPTK